MVRCVCFPIFFIFPVCEGSCGILFKFIFFLIFFFERGGYFFGNLSYIFYFLMLRGRVSFIF